MTQFDATRRVLLLQAAVSGLLLPVVGRSQISTKGTTLAPSDVAIKLRELNAEAIAKGLLSTKTRAPVRLTEANVYLGSLPRLVDIVDRSAVPSPDLATRASQLLSQVNLQERVIPIEELAVPTTRAVKPRYDTVKTQYTKHFNEMIVTSANVSRVKWYADRIIKNRARYENVSAETKVPWFVIGALHALEASFILLGHLHNGDVPLSAVTQHVPSGRPDPWAPPYTWERSAIDALQFDHFSGETDWSLPMTLYRLEGFNGYGYRGKGVNTPYLWSFSNLYAGGKFVQDGKWSQNAVSQQCGAAVMIRELVNRKVIKL